MFRGLKIVGHFFTLYRVVLSLDSENDLQRSVSGRIFLEIDIKNLIKPGFFRNSSILAVLWASDSLSGVILVRDFEFDLENFLSGRFLSRNRKFKKVP